MIAIMAAVSCTDTEVVPSPTVSESSASGVPEQPNGVTRTLALDAREHQTYLVQALDPPTHTFEVRLVVEPLARLSLWFRTPYGQRLDLVRSSITDEGCLAETDRVVCIQEFPALEAQRGGEWTLHVRNLSGRPTAAEITVTFTAL
jgi:hypothetical protein